jgi:hypothetical protein
MNLVLFEPYPRYNAQVAEIMQFGEPNYDVFSPERWPLEAV